MRKLQKRGEGRKKITVRRNFVRFVLVNPQVSWRT